MEENILTAKEIIDHILMDLNMESEMDYLKNDEDGKELLSNLIEMINRRTKQHVQQALKEASEKAEIETVYDNPYNPSMGHSYIVDRDSILNAYSLDNIK